MNVVDRIKAALESDTPGRVEWRTQLESALFEIERLRNELDLYKAVVMNVCLTLGHSDHGLALEPSPAEQTGDGK